MDDLLEYLKWAVQERSENPIGSLTAEQFLEEARAVLLENAPSSVIYSPGFGVQLEDGTRVLLGPSIDMGNESGAVPTASPEQPRFRRRDQLDVDNTHHNVFGDNK